jgi:hypothetical protein
MIDYEAATAGDDPNDAKNASQLTRNLLFSPTHTSYLGNASITKKQTWATLQEFETSDPGGGGEYILLPYAARDSTKNARPVVPAIQVFEESLHLVYFVYGDNPKPKHKVIQYGFDKLHGRALSGNIKLVDASPCNNDLYGYEHFDYQMRYLLHMLSSSGFGDDRRAAPALYNRVGVYSHEKDFKRLMELAIKITEVEDSLPRWLPVKLVVLDNLDSFPKTNLKGHPISMNNLGDAFHSLAATLPCKNDNVNLLLSWLTMSPSATLDKLKAALPTPAPGWFAELSARPPAVASSGEKRGADAVREEPGEDAPEAGGASSKKQKTGEADADAEPEDGDDEMRGGDEEDEQQDGKEDEEQQEQQKEKQSSASKKKKRDEDEESELSGDGSDDGSVASSDEDESEEEESDDSDEDDSDEEDDDSDSDEPKKKKKKAAARKPEAKPSNVAAKKAQPSKQAPSPPKPAERVADAGEEVVAAEEAALAEPEPSTEGGEAVAGGGETAIQRHPRRPVAEGDGKSEAPALRRRKPICLQISKALETMEPSLPRADPTHQMSSKIEKIKDALKMYEETGKVRVTESLLTLIGSLMLSQAKTIEGLLEQNNRSASKAAIRKMETAMGTLGDETPTLQELSDVLNKWATKTTEMMAARMRCTRELDRPTRELSSASGTADAGAASSSSTQESGSQ